MLTNLLTVADVCSPASLVPCYELEWKIRRERWGGRHWCDGGMTATGFFQSLSPIANPALRESAEHGELDAAGWKVSQEAGFPLALLSEERGGIGTDHAFAIAWLPVV